MKNRLPPAGSVAVSAEASGLQGSIRIPPCMGVECNMTKNCGSLLTRI